MFRIGVLESENILTDYNQISLGAVFFIWPFYEQEQEYNIEFRKFK